MNKITSEDLLGKGVIGLADTPGLSTGDMQAKFDEISLGVIIPHFNKLCDDLENGAVDGVVGSGMIKGIRINTDHQIEYTIDRENWYQTAMSGHVVMDAEGKSYPQRGRMQFMTGVEIVDDAKENVTMIKVISTGSGGTGGGVISVNGKADSEVTLYAHNIYLNQYQEAVEKERISYADTISEAIGKLERREDLLDELLGDANELLDAINGISV